MAPRKPKPPDWEAIRSDYIAGHKPSEIGAKFKIPAKRVSDEAARFGWRALREEAAQITRKNLPGAVAAVIVDEAAQWARDTLALARLARAQLAAKLEADATQLKVIGSKDGPVEIPLPFLNDARDWQAYLKSLAEADRLGRVALGLDKPEKGGTPDASQPGARPSRASLDALDPADAIRLYRETL